MNRSSILSPGKGLKAVTIASTEVETGVSHCHGEFESIMLPARNPSSALPGVKVAKCVVRRTILPDEAGVVVAIPKAEVLMTKEVIRTPRRPKRTNLDLGNMIMLIRMSQGQMTLKCMMR